MAEGTVLTKSGYGKLLGDLRRLLEEGKARAEAAARRELVVTYWQVGKRISEEKLTEQAHYGDSVLEDLARDLGLEYTTLTRAVVFFERYKILAPRRKNITWSHYQELIAVRGRAARLFYEREAEARGWTRDELRRAIRRGVYQMNEETSKVSKTLKRPTEATYVYSAVVERVVDGDTLILRIDLGFQVWKEQRIRLAGIDCPEKDTAGGRKAFEWVRDRMAQAEVVMVKTNKVDIYGRYVGHVFYSFEKDRREKVFREGRYLNQELLSRGLAELL